MQIHYWHDLEKTIPAVEGMTVAVIENAVCYNGAWHDMVSENPATRPVLEKHKDGGLLVTIRDVWQPTYTPLPSPVTGAKFGAAKFRFPMFAGSTVSAQEDT